jgi:hypothetical protein
VIIPSENDAREFRRAIHKIDNIRGGGGIKVKNDPDGVTISAIQGARASGIASIPMGVHFSVLVTQVGGSNGNSTTDPTYTYDLHLRCNRPHGQLSRHCNEPNQTARSAHRACA